MSYVMSAEAINAAMTQYKGEVIRVVTTDSEAVAGVAISVNSKGVNVKLADGRTRSIGLGRVFTIVPGDAQDIAEVSATAEVAPVEIAEDVEEISIDDAADDDAEGEVSTGEPATYTTAQLAAEIGMTAKAFRVQLRAWGMGVGQGQTYAFTGADILAIRAKLAEKE